MKILALMAVLAILTVPACSGDNGNGNGDDGGQQTPCGDLTCAKSEACIHDAVCALKPAAKAVASEEVEDIFEPIGDADLSCHNAEPCTTDTDCPTDASDTQLVCRNGFCGIGAPADEPKNVTFRGCIDAFGIGDITSGMGVALYKGTQNPEGSTTWDMVAAEDQAGCEYWGAFEFENVPTNEPLILKTYDDLGGFVTTYKYNVILWSDLARDEGGTFVFDTREDAVADPRTGQDIRLHPWRAFAISTPTFSVILKAAGVNELPDSHGGVAGTIRDCAYHEMQNVSCGFVDKPGVITYFTNSENPRPDQSIDATNVNGIYAAIDLPEGDHIMSCLAQDPSGANVPLGQYDVKIFPQAITIISFDWYPGVE